MRLKEDSSSWRSHGIMRRDYRHDFSTPEVPSGHPKRHIKAPRKKVAKHKHIWVERDRSWFSDLPKIATYYACSICGKDKRIANPRYRYEMYKWCRDNEHWYYIFKRS